MSFKSLHCFDFDGLRFDSENSFLIRISDGEKISLRGKESLLLLELVKKPNQTVTYEELQQAVWSETNDAQMIMRRLQVTKDTLQKKINNLRQSSDDSEIIKSVPSKGYIFVLPVEQHELESTREAERKSQREIAATQFTAAFSAKEELGQAIENYSVPKTNRSPVATTAILLIGVSLISGFLFFYFKLDEENEVRRVVKESQMYESLVLYQNPVSLDENKLKDYWIFEPHNSELDSTRIGKSARNLAEKGMRYGSESKVEQFDFVSIDINENRDFAVVKTIEKWFVPRYRNDGTLIENKTVGPYAVTYSLRKIDGNWLIEKSSTARASSN
jgi:DNA-binding winged helix-turn-helix (wHTH) protein